jgi:hypothetical protein
MAPRVRRPLVPRGSAIHSLRCGRV